MSRVLRRGRGTPPADVEVERWDAPAQEDDWQAQATPSTGARANTAAVVRLVVWALVAAGPVLGVLALHRATAPEPAPRHQQVPADVIRDDPVGPAGFATLFVSRYLESDSEEDGEELAAFYPGAAEDSLRVWGGEEQQAENVAAVRSEQVAEGYWSVTVAAEVTEQIPAEDDAGDPPTGTELRYFQVPVASTGDGGWVAVAYPAEVAAPPTTDETPELGYAPVTPAATDPALETLQQFMGAYLTGAGDVSRYLSPDADVTAVSPAPYAGVQVTEVGVFGDEVPQPGEVLPMPTGARVQVLVQVEAQTPGGAVRPLSYALELAERDGRWEVAEIEPTPGIPDETTTEEDGA